MGDPVTGYVIYYQPEGGAVSCSDMVSGGETETHLLDGLQGGVTYNISIVALSLHLPSLLVGPVTPIPGMALTFPYSRQKLILTTTTKFYKYYAQSWQQVQGNIKL